MEILEGDSSLVTVGSSSMMTGSLKGGWGFPTLILVLLQALKHIDGCLFLFLFFLAGVLSETRTIAASLASLSRDTSSCCFSSSSSVVLHVSTIFYFVFVVSGVVFSSTCWVSTFLLAVLFWVVFGFFFSVLFLFLFSSFDDVFFSALGSTVVVSCFSSPLFFSSFFLLI